MTWHDAVETGTKVWRRTCATRSSHASSFLQPWMRELAVQTALGKVIRAMGVKEFGERAGMAGPNVLRAIHPQHNPTQATLNRLLKPFKLQARTKSRLVKDGKCLSKKTNSSRA